MLTVAEIVDHLVVGELSTHKLGKDGLTDTNHKQWVVAINAALDAIHRRFPIRFTNAYLQQYASISKYKLTYDYAQSNTASTEPTKYIIDSAENPFIERFLLVEGAYDECGDSVGINDASRSTSIYTPEYNVIQVPCPSDFNTLFLTFRLPHERLIEGVDAAATGALKIDVSVTYLDVLSIFAASRILASMGSEGDVMNVNLLASFSVKCNLLETQGMVNTAQTAGPINMESKGWR